MMNKIDLIIPVYNVAPYLRQCLDSVLMQTFQTFKIILVDDGSTDGSGEICEEYAVSHTNIEVVHQENKGLSSAKNTGLKYSTAPYIMFLDSDDWISPQTLEIMYNVMEKGDYDIAQCREKLEYDYNVKTINTNHEKTEVKIYSGLDIYKSFFSHRELGPASWGKIYKREIISNIIFPEGKVHEDIAVIMSIWEKCKSVAYINASLWHYRFREGSISRTHYSSKNRFMYDCVNNMSTVVAKNPILKPYFDGYRYLVVKSLFIMFSPEDKITFSKDYQEYRSILTKVHWNILSNRTLRFDERLSIFLSTSKFHGIIKSLYKIFKK